MANFYLYYHLLQVAFQFCYGAFEVFLQLVLKWYFLVLKAPVFFA